MRTIADYPATQVIPADIQDILDLAKVGALTALQVRTLQEFVKARDTLVVWDRIARQAEVALDLTGVFESSELAITRSKKLAGWMKDNSVRLQNFQRLNLVGLYLTTIPKELGELSYLGRLYLGANRLRSIPKELGEMKNLRLLSLMNNQLRSVPDELGNLNQLWRSSICPKIRSDRSQTRFELCQERSISMAIQFVYFEKSR